ncbi:hypothetical protein B0H13DRAFT_1850065 [Mycena leptocephala]|nr:hypothetical protein B0H13DRAFT_1850065 [Mycena leptocephala]
MAYVVMLRARLGRNTPAWTRLEVALKPGHSPKCKKQVFRRFPAVKRLRKRGALGNGSQKWPEQLTSEEFEKACAPIFVPIGIYPELDWVLTEGRSSIIFPKHIGLGSKIYTYLQRKCPREDRDRRIRVYNSMNFESHNAATRKLLDNPEIESGCQIVIGTDTLSVGINIPVRQDAIVIGDVEDADELMQEGSRVGRDRKLVKDARLIVYVTPAARAAAEKGAQSPGSIPCNQNRPSRP